MNELLCSLAGKECFLYPAKFLGDTLHGTVEAVEDGWLSLRTKAGLEVVPLAQVSHIQIVSPKKKA